MPSLKPWPWRTRFPSASCSVDGGEGLLGGSVDGGEGLGISGDGGDGLGSSDDGGQGLDGSVGGDELQGGSSGGGERLGGSGDGGEGLGDSREGGEGLGGSRDGGEWPCGSGAGGEGLGGGTKQCQARAVGSESLPLLAQTQPIRHEAVPSPGGGLRVAPPPGANATHQARSSAKSPSLYPRLRVSTPLGAKI
ncbi:hypothetical protein PLESTB_000001500 [Pleodorina starrii]|uniref:Uncharacterized protein n=1 Tax=Pleodorina starrii TaxID=330485 RepID=A0A9W6B7U7_9CHLO|nr:hypothetical protein PLESTB_000001500 [Pleodorina starrii]